ncbi:hypothetical protein GIR22_15720 [Pseudomonas sp. CCM 7891]|uniref:Bacterial Ig-like domain-containing protein n=1 Tax=Pseudomonas karstica TaxID=1055468 RepID=A0A7X2RV17_9PSED|nr:Ig-like domain-containing protein [Pseudomonas karstica]MTD20575.1 hypothetical protein [Pseudomonas karstica]
MDSKKKNADVTDASKSTTDAVFLNQATTSSPSTHAFQDPDGDMQDASTSTPIFASTTDEGHLTLTGTTTADAVVEIYDSLTSFVGSTQSDTNGNWSFTTAQAVSQDGHTLSVVVNGQASQDISVNISNLSSVATASANPDLGNDVSAADVTSDESDLPLQVALNTPAGGDSTASLAGATSTAVLATHTIDRVYDDAGGETGFVGNGGTTDDLRPSIRGQSSEIGTFIKLYDNGNFLGSAYVDLHGDWQLQVPTERAFELGEHVLTVVDAAGNTSAPFILTIDIPEASRPVIDVVFDDVGQTGEIANGGTTDDRTPTLRGHGEAGAQIFLYNGSALVGSTFVQPDGSYTLSTTLPLAPGEHTLTVVVNRIASQPFTLTVTDTEPAIKPVIDSAFDNFGSTGEIANGGTTDDATPLLQGKGEGGAQVVIYNGDVRIGSTYSSPDGYWSFNVTTLNQGEHVFTVISTTAAGTPISSDPFTLTVSAPNSVKPVIDSVFDNFGSTGEIANGGTTDDATPLLQGKGEGGVQVVIYNGDMRIGSTYSSPDGYWSFNVPMLNQGEHVFTVVNAGVSSDPFTLTISAPDSAKPVIDSVFDNIGTVGELVSGSTTDDARPTFQGRGEPSTYLNVYDNGVPIAKIPVALDGSWSYTNHANRLSPGEHIFTFVGAGVTSEPFVLYMENVPETPKPTIDSAFDNVGAETGSVISGALIDDPRPVFSGHGEPDATIFIYDNYGYAGAALVDDQGNWTFQPSKYDALNPGEHVFTAVADGVRSEPFVLQVEAATQAIQMATNEGESDLPSLFDLLQTGSDLFAEETDITPLGDAVLDLSSAVFDEDLYAGSPQFETTEDIPGVFSTVASTDFWQQPTEYPVG